MACEVQVTQSLSSSSADPLHISHDELPLWSLNTPHYSSTIDPQGQNEEHSKEFKIKISSKTRFSLPLKLLKKHMTA